MTQSENKTTGGVVWESVKTAQFNHRDGRRGLARAYRVDHGEPIAAICVYCWSLVKAMDFNSKGFSIFWL